MRSDILVHEITEKYVAAFKLCRCRVTDDGGEIEGEVQSRDKTMIENLTRMVQGKLPRQRPDTSRCMNTERTKNAKLLGKPEFIDLVVPNSVGRKQETKIYGEVSIVILRIIRKN